MKRRTSFFILAVLLCFKIGFAAPKILVIVETNCMAAIATWVYLYCNAIENVDHKHCEVIDWTNPTGSMMDQCQALRDILQQEYFEARNAGDALEGAVLIGDVCVPISAELG